MLCTKSEDLNLLEGFKPLRQDKPSVLLARNVDDFDSVLRLGGLLNAPSHHTTSSSAINMQTFNFSITCDMWQLKRKRKSFRVYFENVRGEHKFNLYVFLNKSNRIGLRIDNYRPLMLGINLPRISLTSYLE